MHINLKLCFRNIYINGFQKIPNGKPLVFASNHPNSFLDGMIMDVVLNRPLHIVIRGDAMKSKMANAILKLIKLIPIHRLSEGKENLYKNDETFETCKNKLLRNEAIIIFSEGLCIHEKKLRPLKKGTARIILPFLEKYPEKELVVLPLGLNYSSFEMNKPDLMIQIGNELNLENITNEFKTNQAKAINSFNLVLSEKMKEQIIHFEEKVDEVEFDKNIFPLFKTHHVFTYIKDNSMFEDIQVKILKPETKINYSSKKYNTMLYKFFHIFVTLSNLIYSPVKKLIQNLSDKKVKNIVFKNSVIVALNMLLGFFYLLTLNILIGIIFGFKIFLIGLVCTYLYLHLLAIMQNYVINFQKNKI